MRDLHQVKKGKTLLHEGTLSSCFDYLVDGLGFVFVSDAEREGYSVMPVKGPVIVVNRGPSDLEVPLWYKMRKKG